MSHPNSPFGNFHLRTEIPYFCGEYVDWWIYHIECFFQKRGTIPEMKTRVAEVYMVGEALHWYKEWDWKARWSWPKITWETFVEDLKNRFKPHEIVKSEVLRSILMDIEKVKQLIVEMRAQNLAYMASLSELKHYSSTISRVQVTESKAAEDEQFDSKQIILVKPDSVISDSQEITATTQLSVCTHEGDNALVKDCIPSLRPMLYEPPEVSTEVYSHHLPMITLRDGVELVTDMGCFESENVASPVVLGTSSLCCTVGVCENVCEAYLYPKMICLGFQGQNTHMVVNDVSFILDWLEKLPPFPPDISHDAILYKTLQAVDEDDHVLTLLRLESFSVDLCLKECIPTSRTEGILSFWWLLYVCVQFPITCTADEQTYRMKIVPVEFQKLAEGSQMLDSAGESACQCTMVYVVTCLSVEHYYLLRSDGTNNVELFQNFNREKPIELMMPLSDSDSYHGGSNGMTKLQGMVFYLYMLKVIRCDQRAMLETELNSWWDFPWDFAVAWLAGFLFKQATISNYFHCGQKLQRQMQFVVLYSSKQGIIRMLYQFLRAWFLQGFGDMKTRLTLMVIDSRNKGCDADKGQHDGHESEYDLLNILVTVANMGKLFFNFTDSKGKHPNPSSVWSLFPHFLHKLPNDKYFSTEILNQKQTIHFGNLLATFNTDLGVLKQLVSATKTPYSRNVQRAPSQQASFRSIPHLNIHDSLSLLSSKVLLIDKEPNKIDEDGLELFHMHVISIPIQRGWYQYLKCSLLGSLLVLSSFIIELFAFSLPRPQNTDLEDKVILKGGGIDTIITTDWIDYVLIMRTFLE